MSMSPFSILLCWLLIPLAASALPRRLILAVGETRRLPVPAQGKIFLPKSKDLQVRELGSSLELRALHSGFFTVRAGSQTADILVMPSTGAAPLEAALDSLEGLRWRFDRGLWHIGGELWRFADWLRIAQILEPGSYRFEASMDPEVHAEARQYFLNELRKWNLPMPASPLDLPHTPRFGHMPAVQTKALQEVFSRYGLKAETNASGLTLEPLVRLRVLVAEVNREFSLALGLDWQAAYRAQILPNMMADGTLAVQLNAMEKSGRGQVLASPNLVCRSGGEANFMAGGEIPIRMMSYSHNQVQWKRHGVLLHFKPLADASGHMTLALAVEVSMVDPAVMIDGVPGLKTNRIESQLNFTSNKTIALSGLLRNVQGRAQRGLAFLQDLPVLGALFRSRDYLESRTQLVVFVTSELEPLDGPGETPRPPDHWEQPEYLQ
jgi:pilus assembly protein CpaC